MLSPRTVAGVATLAFLVPAPMVLSLPDPAAATTPTVGCGTRLFSHVVRAKDAQHAYPEKFKAAARKTGISIARFEHAAQDDSFWLDPCGQGFYVEKAVVNPVKPTGDPFADPAGASAGTASATGSATALRPLRDTFLLESNPGASKTIYLDFKGGEVANTAWNANYTGGQTMVVEPYAPSFGDLELTEVQKAWQVVAEDFAPFDVNVTTKDPGLDAIDRSSPEDNVYGARIMVTSGGPVYDRCMPCGGYAFINVFNNSAPNHMMYQPAFVFTNGVGTSGRNVGEAASHEAGHNFGLNHDAVSGNAYYYGESPWAPIMGAGYSQPVSQWSAGEYPGATNSEDDLSIISGGAALRADDHGDTAANATALSLKVTTPGIITTRNDIDAFTFTAAGYTTVTVTPAQGLPDLDIQVTIVDSSGNTVATQNPVVQGMSGSFASNLDATWAGTLPDAPAAYTVLVEGVGNGDPAVAGQYSDYGSLGNYQITVDVAKPMSWKTARALPFAKKGQFYSKTIRVRGGIGPYKWSLQGSLPRGLTLTKAHGSNYRTLKGIPKVRGTYTFQLKVTDGTNKTIKRTFTITIK